MSRPQSKVREERTIYYEWLKHQQFPPWWRCVRFSDVEILQMIAHVNNVPMTETDRIEQDLSSYVRDSKSKVVGRMGKIAVMKYFSLSSERLYGKKRGFMDFIVGDMRMMVKTNGRIKGECLMIDERDLRNSDGPNIYLGVNLEFDEENVYRTCAWITGWIYAKTFVEKAFVASDITGNPLYMNISKMNQPDGLKMMLKLKQKR